MFEFEVCFTGSSNPDHGTYPGDEEFSEDEFEFLQVLEKKKKLLKKIKKLCFAK